MSKDKYRIGNWSAYNRGLKQRGRINIWIEAEAFAPTSRPHPVGKGRPRRYTDAAILVCLVVGRVYHQPLRAAQGFVQSLSCFLKLGGPVPDYTTVCRRAQALEVSLSALQRGGISDVAIDATGLKVYGEGEWKVRKHGYGRHRTWRKLHLAVNTDSGQLEAAALSCNSTIDAAAALPLVAAVVKRHPVRRVLGDGAYDKARVRSGLQELGIGMVFPPQHNAVMAKGTAAWQRQRNQSVERIRDIGLKQWKVEEGYHRRSVAETAMFRYKTIIGARMRSRKMEQQRTEAAVGCRILNQMLQLAKPLSAKVA